MEQFKKEKGDENVSFVINKEKLDSLLWGHSLDTSVEELIKVFAIIRHLQEKKITSVEQARETVSDLFREFDISLFRETDLFNAPTLQKLMQSKPIETLFFEFNGVPLKITGTSTVNSVLQDWENAKDPTLKQKKETEQKEFIRHEQEIIDKMVRELDQLNFNSIDTVVDWLYEYNHHVVEGVDIHDDVLLEKFKQHGYGPEKNDTIEFMLGQTLKDKRRFGEALVGFMLMNPGLFLRNKEMKKMIDQWKQS